MGAAVPGWDLTDVNRGDEIYEKRKRRTGKQGRGQKEKRKEKIYIKRIRAGDS